MGKLVYPGSFVSVDLSELDCWLVNGHQKRSLFLNGQESILQMDNGSFSTRKMFSPLMDFSNLRRDLVWNNDENRELTGVNCLVQMT